MPIEFATAISQYQAMSAAFYYKFGIWDSQLYSFTTEAVQGKEGSRLSADQKLSSYQE